MPFQAWILHTVVKKCLPLDGFNGAMPFQAWILYGLVIAPPQGYRLQWGHALSGMDTPLACALSV